MYSDFENVQQKKQASFEQSEGQNDSINDIQQTLQPPAMQLKCDACSSEDESIQAKFSPFQMKVNQLKGEEEEEGSMLKKDPSQLKVSQFDGLEEEEETASLKKAPGQLKSTVQPIQRADDSSSVEGLKNHMSEKLGHDFSGVNVETNSQSTKDMGALAMAQGKTVSFAPGQFQPNTKAGLELAGHEFKHVQQQDNNRVKANTSVNGMPVNDDKGLEKEADNAGKLAAQTKLKET